jgi:glycosyltransferase involved in cell wall biosynthesis
MKKGQFSVSNPLNSLWLRMLDNQLTNVKLIVLIPVYNHAQTLRDVVLRALKVNDSVMVVDDGSTDGGIDTLTGLDVHIVRHGRNRGKGAAILTAAKACRQLGITHIVTSDADGQHDPFEIQKFLPKIHSEPFSIIVGKRNFQTANVPRLTKFGRHFSNFWFRIQTGQSLSDTQSGFRAYPLLVLENLKLREKRFAFEVEVLVKAAWAGVKLQEVDINVLYPPADKRISHFRVFRDNWQISLLNTKFTMMSMFPIPHRQILGEYKNEERITLRHPIRSIKKLLTQKISPGRLAAAGALGVFLGTLPLIGIHTITILFTAGFFRWNKIVALSTSQMCMPPLVPALCIETGYFLRHGKFLTEISLNTLGHQALQRCYEWLLGSILLAPVLAVLIAGVIYIMAYFIKRTVRATG